MFARPLASFYYQSGGWSCQGKPLSLLAQRRPAEAIDECPLFRAEPIGDTISDFRTPNGHIGWLSNGRTEMNRKYPPGLGSGGASSLHFCEGRAT